MPKAKKNGQWLEWLQDMRDEEDRDSNKYMIYDKAVNSLKKQAKEYHDPDSLLEVKFIGPGIVQRFKKRWKEAGGVATMDEIPSNLPSPTKRKRTSGTAASSQPQKQSRSSKMSLFHDASDDDGDDGMASSSKRRAEPLLDEPDLSGSLPAPSRRPQLDIPHIFPPLQYPLGIPPNAQQLYSNPTSQGTYAAPQFPYNRQQYGYPPTNAYDQPAIPAPVHVQPQPLHRAQPPQPFNCVYIDSNRKQVRSQEMAEVDIHEGALWYRLRYLDVAGTNAHPLGQRIRPILSGSLKGKWKEEHVEGWISDQDVEQYGLHIAPGISEVRDPLKVESNPGPASNSSCTASQAQLNNSRENTIRNLADGKLKGLQHDSLEDLLKAESRKKKNSTDPTRVVDVDREWDVGRNGFISNSRKDMVKTETREHNSRETHVSMRQRLAMAAMARQQPPPATATSSDPSAPTVSQHITSGSTANPVLRRSKTLPETSHASQSSSFPFQSVDPVVPPTTRYVVPSAPEVVLRRTNTAPVASSSAETVTKPKPKQKGRDRGRVSNFAPALPAVDEFDVDLDRQAANYHVQSEKHPSTSASNVSADLIDDVTDLTFAAAPSFPAFDPIVFPAYSYDIALVLDSREVKSQKNRDHIVLELQKRGVNVEQRSLTLGDVLWIAKRRQPIAGAEDNECVLDYILERKRLDDLCGSIKDGRFHEQKFRLSNTGLKVFYLIEDYDVEKNREHFGVQIDTARSSTQVVDGFIVKETKKLSYTIDYLAAMHQTILEIHQHKTVYMIPPPLIKRHSYMALQKHLRLNEPSVGYLTSYACFERLNSKSANLTARDILAQMLLCVKGLSAEKAAAIIETYPTIRSLWSAFRAAEVIEQDGLKQKQTEAGIAASQGTKGRGRKKNTVPLAKTMLCDPEGSGRKRIGPALSENLHRLMRANAYEE